MSGRIRMKTSMRIFDPNPSVDPEFRHRHTRAGDLDGVNKRSAINRGHAPPRKKRNQLLCNVGALTRQERYGCTTMRVACASCLAFSPMQACGPQAICRRLRDAACSRPAVRRGGARGRSHREAGDPHVVHHLPARPFTTLRGYPETLSLPCYEITQQPCGHETLDDHHE